MVDYQLPHITRTRRWQGLHRWGLILTSAATLAGSIASPTALSVAQAQVAGTQALTLRADVQEANAVTGVITARGNVQINYPARQIQATSVQAQYYSRERRIVLSGNVYVLQGSNSMRGETVTYLIDEGRFLAVPETGRQVESIYVVEDPNGAIAPTSTFNPKPEFKAPVSPP